MDQMHTTDAAPMDAQAMAARAQETIKARLQAIVSRLQTEADERVNKRTHIEKRWLDDLRQYHGQYDDATLKNLTENEGSRVFVNLTRPKTDAMSARLEDLLFPTDDRNWGIRPTPVPNLTEDADQAVSEAEELEKQAEAAQAQAQGGDPQAMMQAQEMSARANAARDKAARLQAIVAEAKRRSDLMQKEIEDQLKESSYHAVSRDQIDMAAKIGTGVTKGPVTGDMIRKGWKQRPQIDEYGNPVIGPDGQPVPGDYELNQTAGNQPGMRYVDIWNWFPDMDARTVEESDGFFERHLLNAKGLRKLSLLPGFSKAAIRRLLEIKPQSSAPSYLVDLRNITGQNSDTVNDRYHVWEYTGCLTAEEIRDLALAFEDHQTLTDVEDADPLDELNVIVWFCQGEVLKFAIYPYDSSEPIYSVFNLLKDDSSIFGFGIPWMMREAQRALNAAWRMMMDNAALGTGPQLFIDKKQIEPADGKWTMKPRKVWFFKDGVPKDQRVMDQFAIDMRQNELSGIIALASKFIDDETAIPQIAQGEQGSHITKTAQGMAILMNATNTVFRRIVKNFDDDVTVPTIRRFYDWNMQFNEKDAIKGDFDVDARGSSVLLVREMQAQNLFALLLQLGAHPVYGPMLRHAEGLRLLMRTFLIPSDEIVLTDKEIEKVMAQAAEAEQEEEQGQGGNGADPMDAEIKRAELEFKRQELQMKVELANMDRDTKLRLAEIQRDTTMMQMAERLNMTMEQVQAKLQDSREEREARERKFVTELAVTERQGPSGGGHF